MGEHIHLYGETVNCVERFAIAIKNNTESPEQVGSSLNRLEDQIDYYCNANARTAAIENILSKSLDSIKKSENGEDAKKICELFDKNLKKINNIQDHMNPWRNIIKKLTGDEDIQMVKSSQNVIDPISKKRLVDPVKNTDCGHTYEKSVVLELISKNPKTRCPIPGCSAGKYILESNLIPDNDLKRFLENNADESLHEDNSQIVSLDDTC